MSEWRLFADDTVPECTTPAWYAKREAAGHLEQEGHRQRLLKTHELCVEAASRNASTVCDLGAGDGGLLSIIKPYFDSAWGYDLQQTNIDQARETRHVDVSYLDVTQGAWTAGQLVVACELLEHLVDPHALVREIHGRGVEWLVASSPYTETPSDHYEHHCWAWDDAGYRKLLEDAGWTVVRTAHVWICGVWLCAR